MSRLLTLVLSLGLTVLLAPAAEISTIAGTGTAGRSGDGGPGVRAKIANVYGLEIGPDGALYFCEIDNHIIRRLDLSQGKISTVAGNGTKGYAGDGGPALQASLNEPYEVRFDRAGNMFFVEMRNHIVRRVDAKTNIISTVAGNGAEGFGGDGGKATQAQLSRPHSIALDLKGSPLHRRHWQPPDSPCGLADREDRNLRRNRPESRHARGRTRSRYAA